jgi:hypothetical protein
MAQPSKKSAFAPRTAKFVRNPMNSRIEPLNLESPGFPGSAAVSAASYHFHSFAIHSPASFGSAKEIICQHASNAP